MLSARLGAPPNAATPAPRATAGDAPSSTAIYPAERWERVALLPGLELHVRSDAGPLVRRVAEEIHARYSLVSDG